VKSLVAVFQAAIWVKSVYMIKQKKENMKIINLYINLNLEGVYEWNLQFEFSGRLMPEGALTSFYRM